MAALAGVASTQLLSASASADAAKDDHPTVTVVRCWPDCIIDYPPMPKTTTPPKPKPKPKPAAMTAVAADPADPAATANPAAAR